MMKNKMYAVAFVFLIVSCSKEEGIVENISPNETTLISPVNNFQCQDATVELTWAASTDPDGDSIRYSLEIALDSDFSSIEESFTEIDDTKKRISLVKGTTYFWRVKVKDDHGLESSFSSIYKFHTEANPEINHLPFLPSIISPVQNAIVTMNEIELLWDASDLDQDDTLSYDLYVSLINEPSEDDLISSNQTEKRHVVDINSNGIYYWKVVVKDSNGGKSIGQVWSFIKE